MTDNKKLTKSYIDSINSPGFYWDKDVRGFGLRISGKTKSYIVQARIDGKDTRRTIGRHGVFTVDEARKRARETLVQMANGMDPKAESRARREESTSLQELFAGYISRKKLAPRTLSDYNGYMSRYFSDWLTKPITEVNMDMVEQRHTEVGRKHGEAQADVAMRCLRALYNYAEGVYTRKDGTPLVTCNPTKRLNAKKQWFKPNRRETYITEDRLSIWFKATIELRAMNPGSNTETTCDYLLFLLFTGLRRTEASLIRWEHVDFDGHRFLLPRANTKNDTNFSLPFTTFTNALLKKRQLEKTSEFVFPGSGRVGHIAEPRYAMRKITEATGIEFTLHDLRRTYATCGSAVIDNTWVLKRLMNHLTGQDITERYILGVERLREPAQRITGHILSLIENGPAIPGATK